VNNSNIIFILQDALRYDVFEKYVRHMKKSTFMRLLKNSIYFNNHYTAVNATDPSIMSILSGKHPLNTGIINHGNKIKEIEKFKAKTIKTILNELREKYGYKTIILDILNRWYKNIFDIYVDLESYPGIRYYLKILSCTIKEHQYSFTLKPIVHYLIKKILFRNRRFIYPLFICPVRAIDHTIKMIKKYKKNMFIFIHLWSTHIPYLGNGNNKMLESIVEDIIKTNNIKNIKTKNIIKQFPGKIKFA